MSETAVVEAEFIQTAIEPMERVNAAKKQADALMQIVNKTKISKSIGGKQFLQVEAWQTIAAFNGYMIDTAWSRPIIEDGKKVGYEARAELVRISDGTHMAGAEAECRFDETIGNSNRERWGDDFEARSMAQTRASSKVGRMAFAWVAVLAGFQPTPAEEMLERHEQQRQEQPRQDDDKPFPEIVKGYIAQLHDRPDVARLNEMMAHAAKLAHKPTKAAIWTEMQAYVRDSGIKAKFDESKRQFVAA